MTSGERMMSRGEMIEDNVQKKKKYKGMDKYIGVSVRGKHQN